MPSTRNTVLSLKILWQWTPNYICRVVSTHSFLPNGDWVQVWTCSSLSNYCVFLPSTFNWLVSDCSHLFKFKVRSQDWERLPFLHHQKLCGPAAIRVLVHVRLCWWEWCCVCHQITFTAIIWPVGLWTMLLTEPYAPRPISPRSLRSSAVKSQCCSGEIFSFPDDSMLCVLRRSLKRERVGSNESIRSERMRGHKA